MTGDNTQCLTRPEGPMAPPTQPRGGSHLKKKSRRSSKEDVATLSHYGPVASTNAALVQAYLAPAEATQQQQRGSSAHSAGKDKSMASRPVAGINESALHMSESRFDSVKRRFGGRSRPVSLVTARGSGSNGRSAGRGARLTFLPTAKVVATKVAMHAALRCRCVFVLLYESAASHGASSGSDGGPSTTVSGEDSRDTTSRFERPQSVDTAHLVTLSPNDLFSALSVNTFCLSVPSSDNEKGCGGGARGDGRSGGSDASGRCVEQVAVGELPRGFDIMDGPVVLHRPAARPGEHWRGLEIFRSEPDDGTGTLTMRSFRGQRATMPPIALHSSSGNGTAVRRDREHNSVFGSRPGKSSTESSFRLDLDGANDGKRELPSGGDDSGSKKRGGGAVLVCPPSECYSVHAEAGFSPSEGRGFKSAVAVAEGRAGIVALPTVAAAPVTAAASEAATGPHSIHSRYMSSWASLAFDQGGRALLSPLYDPPSEWGSSLMCLCPAPATDSGIVSLADATPGVDHAGGLVLHPVPPIVYVGVTDDRDRRAHTSRVASGGERGALLELQEGGALSCARSLPAPPSAVVTAAVDDGRGVLVVLLEDSDGTALLLARDGCDFPVVEEYRGVAAVFTGDFLGNGREQVALLSQVSLGPKSAEDATALFESGAEWEQLPLKSQVKRALVTDCSCVWGQGLRDDLAALPGAGVIDIIDVRRSGNDAADVAAASISKATATGRKRQRTESGGNTADDKRQIDKSVRASNVAAGSGSDCRDGGVGDDCRLGRLSAVVGVLRRRVQAEEARLLRLRQAQRGKTALLNAARLSLMAQVDGTADGGSVGEVPGLLCSAVEKFSEGLVPCFPGAVPTATPASSPPTAPNVTPRQPLRCAVDRVRFHAPSRTLCLDAHVESPHDHYGIKDDATATMTGPDRGPGKSAAVNVCLSVASPSGRLSTRSAVCPRLAPGASATIRACVEVPTGLLSSGAGTSAVEELSDGTVALYASCQWSWECSNPVSTANDTEGKPSTAAETAAEEDVSRVNSSAVFARVLVSPQDMLGVGILGSASGDTQFLTPLLPTTPTEPSPSRYAASSDFGRKGSNTSCQLPSGSSVDGAGCGDAEPENCASLQYPHYRQHHHLGLFDVGTRLDLLLHSDSTSLAALPQAVRTLSSLTVLPEPWAGGAAALVVDCSERTAECTLRSGDSAGASTVLLQVTAGALPDGVSAFANHASEEGRTLVMATAKALREEMEAVEIVARERRRAGGQKPAGDGDEGVGTGESSSLSRALERYTDAQMRSDLIASQLAGRLVAAAGGGRGGGGN